MKYEIYSGNIPGYTVIYDYPRDRFFLAPGNLAPLTPHHWRQLMERFTVSTESASTGQFVSWIVSPTSRCDGRCDYCFADHYHVGDCPLTPPGFRELAEKAAKSGILRCDISGGEPFLRNDLEDIIAAMLPYTGVCVTTASRNIPAKRLNRISQLLPFIQVSLDGDTDQMNYPRHLDTVKILQTIKDALAAGLKLRILTVAHKYNYEHLRRFGHQLGEWGIWEWKVIRAAASGKARQWNGLLRDNQARELLSQLNDLPLPTQLVGFTPNPQRVCIILEDDLHLHVDRDGQEIDLGKSTGTDPFVLLPRLPGTDAVTHLNYYLYHHAPGGMLIPPGMRQSLKKPDAPLEIRNSKHEIRNKLE